MQYSQIDVRSEGSSSVRRVADDVSSVASSLSRKSRFRMKRGNSDLSQPLTGASTTALPRDEEAASDHSDPYFMFRDDLMEKLEIVDESLAEYTRIVHETNTAVDGYGYKEAKKQLKRHMKNAEGTLRDVQTTVQVVENGRDKFPHIDDSQLYDRKTLVNASKDRLQRAKEDMNSEDIKRKLLVDERNKAIWRSGDGPLGTQTDAERHNTAFVADSQAQTSLLMQQQDETLDELNEVVVRVGEMAGNIHSEINAQNKMLEEMEEDMENAEEELGMVMGKLAKFLKTKDRWQLTTIIALSATALLLFFLVLYT